MGQDNSAATAQISAAPAWMHELADMATAMRARKAAARGLPAPAPVVVATGPRQLRPVQPLPAGFDVEAARAELAALESRGATPTEYAYTGESAAEMAAWRESLHRHQVAGLRQQIAQYEAKAMEAA